MDWALEENYLVRKEEKQNRKKNNKRKERNDIMLHDMIYDMNRSLINQNNINQMRERKHWNCENKTKNGIFARWSQSQSHVIDIMFCQWVWYYFTLFFFSFFLFIFVSLLFGKFQRLAFGNCVQQNDQYNIFFSGLLRWIADF